jgi:hypothetical protein
MAGPSYGGRRYDARLELARTFERVRHILEGDAVSQAARQRQIESVDPHRGAPHAPMQRHAAEGAGHAAVDGDDTALVDEVGA